MVPFYLNLSNFIQEVLQIKEKEYLNLKDELKLVRNEKDKLQEELKY